MIQLPSSYKELFCRYQQEHYLGDEYYRDKQKVAEIFQRNFNGSEEALLAMDSCMKKTLQKKNSSNPK